MRKIFISTLLIIMMSAATALAANWQQIYTDNDDNVIYFDADSVQITSITETRDVTTFSAKFRMEYSEKGRNALIDWYRNYSIVPAGIESLSYDISTIQFKKEGDKRYYHISDRDSYTASGAEISGMHYMNAEPTWQEIPVASNVDIEYSNAFLIVSGKKYEPYT
ncbi:MAG: hypothetical protein IJT57_05940 [Selenomonadaceae bacterium]|nr:hypothetical protein [Selenomonadaceae bacterium]MBQ7723849.1 hypothetical protein [Selenomonadaceae bacterium]